MDLLAHEARMKMAREQARDIFSLRQDAPIRKSKVVWGPDSIRKAYPKRRWPWSRKTWPVKLEVTFELIDLTGKKP
jgi:hypothetical protein